MSDNHVFDELSAYMDGECRDTQRITRHLQSCPECARHHLELLRLSNHLRAMPRPEVSSAFTTRVLANLETNAPSERWSARFIRHPALALALAASLMLIGIGAAYRAGQKDVRTEEHPNVALDVLADDEALTLALEELLEEETWKDPLITDGDGEELLELPAVDVLLDALATWTLEEDPGAWYEEEDWTSVMDALAREDVDVLNDLTRNHWDKV